MLLPAAAAPIGCIEAVSITAGMVPRPRTVPGDTIDVWVEDEARSVLGLLGEVPEGERARCFVPGYGLRAHTAHEVLFEVALCFRCKGSTAARPARARGVARLTGLRRRQRTRPAAHAPLPGGGGYSRSIPPRSMSTANGTDTLRRLWWMPVAT